MENLQDSIVGGDSKSSISGFFNHVFNFDSENKANMMNLVQYIAIGLIPVVLVLKLIKHYIPEENDSKGTPEITIEILAQLLLIFFAIWFIDKTIRYIPTFSRVNYHKFNEVNFVLPVLIILVTMQTKLGAKVNILAARFMDLWNGNQQPNTKQNNVKVTQPIVTPGGHQVSRADNLDNTIIQPPTQQQPQNNVSMIDGLPNMVNSIPTQVQSQSMNMAFMDNMEPMAANGALGGGFGSMF